MTPPTAASRRTSRSPGVGLRQRPARPAATPTQPSANTWYGTHGPIPPPISAETRIESAPAMNPNDVPKTKPEQSTRKKIGLKPPIPTMTASRRAESRAAMAARSAMARESSCRVPASTRKRPATHASINAHAGGRLVKEDEVGPSGEDGSQGGGLSFAGRQVTRVTLRQPGQAKRAQDHVGVLPVCRAVECQLDLRADGRSVQQGGWILGQVRDASRPALDGACLRRQHARDDAQQPGPTDPAGAP